MSALNKRYQVFISSTYEDLIEERQAVMHALLELECIPSGMELFPASDDDQWTLIKSVIDDCDYYIVIIAGKYGSIGSAGISYTRMEYEYAISKNKPVIAFLYKDISQLSGKQLEVDDLAKKRLLEDFRSLAKSKTCKFWTNKDELGSIVSRSLVQQIRTKPAIGWVRSNLVADESAAQEILRLRRELEQLHKIKPGHLCLRPELRNDDYYKHLASKYPRNAIQEAWECFQSAAAYVLTIHNLLPENDFQSDLVKLIGHGDVPNDDIDLLTSLHSTSQQAMYLPEFQIEQSTAIEQIAGMLKYAKKLISIGDGILEIRRNWNDSSSRKESTILPSIK